MQKYLILLLILCFSLANSQIKQSKAKFDFACFPISKDSISLELYFQVSSKEIKYYPIENQKYKATLDFEFIILNLKDSTSEKINWKFETQNNIESLNKDLQVIGIKKFKLLSNINYRFDVVMQNDSTNLYNSSFNVNKRVDLNSKVYLSDIEFAHLIKVENQSNSNQFLDIYKKNGFIVLPNSTAEMYGNDIDINLYFEINDLDTSSNKYNLKYEILNGINKSLNSFEFELTKSSKHKTFEIRTIPLFDLTTGIYNLKSTVYFNNFLDSVLIFKKFYYLNPLTTPKLEANFRESQAFEESLFTSYSDNKIKIEFEMTKPILTEFEIDEFSRLSTLKAKQRALFRFWKFRDADTSTAKNELYIEYHQRLEYIDDQFTYGRKNEAYKTDRGRIILKYGMPTLRNRYSSNSEKVACEEWFFDASNGGIYFYFVDRSGNDLFELVHSNAKNEPKDFNWVQNYNPNIDTDNSSRFKDPNDFKK
jgi:GWxTD domain-containing protein